MDKEIVKVIENHNMALKKLKNLVENKELIKAEEILPLVSLLVPLRIIPGGGEAMRTLEN